MLQDSTRVLYVSLLLLLQTINYQTKMWKVFKKKKNYN